MKKIIAIFMTLLIISALSGCSNPLEKPVPNPKPTQSSIDSGTSTSQSNAGQNTGTTSASNDSGSIPGNSSYQNSSDQVTEALQGAETVTVDGKVMVKNTQSILVLVNKTRNLPSDYTPPDLVLPQVSGNKAVMKMRKEAADALERLFSEASNDGIKLYAASGYRPYSLQLKLYNNEVNATGSEEAANKVVAIPGQSEHQTGLAMDVSSASVNYGLVDSFDSTKEGIWLKEHAKDEGFIIRYQKDKVDITGYSYEPWHIRYVGKEAAEYITSHDITFDQYSSMLANS